MRIRRGMACAAVFSLCSAGLVAAPTQAYAAEARPIAEIQGTGEETPLAGQQVTTEPSYVTAVYGSSGSDFKGFVIQSPDTGGDKDLSTASDAIFVYMDDSEFSVEKGDLVSVTGTAGEYKGLTQLAGDVTITPSEETGLAEPTPVTTGWQDTAENRENLESMLYQSAESFLVSDTYPLLSYGELGLAADGALPVQPTDVGKAGSDEAASQAAENARIMVTLDDGTNLGFDDRSLPYLTPEQDVTVGDSLSLTEPVIVDYRNDTWKLNPTSPISAGEEPATITPEAAPEAPAPGGDFTVASFNVLNYFTTVGKGRPGCDSDDLDNVTYDCDVRGAWDEADLARQQEKIVTAINDLDASVVGLMEIENSAVLGEEADEATTTLVAALNEAAGTKKWEVVPTSAQLQEAGHDDVITNALIFQPAKVELDGEAQALEDDAFANARTPIAASFAAADGGEPTLVAVNHFKSKSSSDDATGDNADSGDGQGAWNGDRERQAQALVDWLPTLQEEAGTNATVLLGDFNSYSQEDPMQVLYGAGFTSGAPYDQYSYNYSGLSGSLDHVLVNEAAEERRTGGEVWNINAGESTALEYSKYDATADDFHAATPQRSSDHDPVIIGLEAGEAADDEDPVAEEGTLTFLNINDFHGRIAPDSPDTVAFFGTVAEQEAEAGEDQSLFLSAGDNIGASLFASSIQEDNPTIDVLNAAGLDSSAVGNHEFDKGMSDLTGRVADRTDWDYTGANVYQKGTEEPVLEEFTTHEVAGRTVAVIGVVTGETSSLVAPEGIKDIEFGDPVDAVNRVTAELTDGDDANGEADVIVAEYHEGAVEGQPTGDLESEVSKGGAFAKIVNETSADVDVIFTGHTHQTYAWDAPIPGEKGQTRPIVQTGSYGEHLGKVTLTLDEESGAVTAYTAENLEVTDTPKDELIDTYPQVKEINDIVNEALAAADELGKPVIGEATGPITRAELGQDPENPGQALEDRAGESTISNLVASMFRDQIDGAQIGVQNPGGNRADLDEGDISFGEAAAVLPFANTLNTVELTGAQFKTVLEQQWQVDENGDPIDGSRPYLQLGLSDNVSYTYDESQPWGERITSITVDGDPYDPESTYTVGTASFLASGGDNFWAFGEGANRKDTGKIDLDSWTDWIKEKETVSPSFARRAVAVTPLPTSLTAGETTTLQVGSTERATGGPNNTLDLTSQESVTNTDVTATLDDVEIGTAEVTDGVAELDLAVPADAPTEGQLVLTASPSETVVSLPVTIEGQDSGTEPTVKLLADKVAAGDDVVVQLSGWPAHTDVDLELHSDPVELRTLTTEGNGAASGTVTIPEDTTPGTHEVVAIAGDTEVSVTITITAGAGAGAGGSSGGSAGGLADTGATGDLLAVLLLGLGTLGVGALVLGTRKVRA